VTPPARTANDRFKRSWNRAVAAGLLAAAVIIGATVVFTPPFRAPMLPDPYRLLLVVDTLRNVRITHVGNASLHSSMASVSSPRLRNLPAAQIALYKSYPQPLWDAREESIARLLVWIDTAGAVYRVEIVDEAHDLAATTAILEIARALRYAPGRSSRGVAAVMGELTIAIETPVLEGIPGPNERADP
jgi:hypothetical protein